MLSLKQQTMLISLWVSDERTFARTNSIVQPGYFDPELRKPISFIKQYYDKYSGIPIPDVITAETDFVPKIVKLSTDQQKFTEDSIETFCRQSALKKVITTRAAELVVAENYGELEAEVRKAISIQIDSDIGISFFKNIKERQADVTSAHRYSLGYPDLDKNMDGGIARREMLLMLATSGGGKSVSVLNFCIELIQQRDVKTNNFLNCLLVSLELSEDMIDKRTQMIVTGKSSKDVQTNKDDVREQLESMTGRCGDLIIKRMKGGSTANDIRTLVKEIEIQNGWIPDVIFLDYLDKLHPIQKVSTENIGTRDKFITEEFYELLNDLNTIGLTASQLTKDAATVEVYNQSHQAGGAEKTRSADWVMAIHLTDAQRAAGQIGFQFLKTRSSGGVGNTIQLGWDAKSLRVYNPSDKQRQMEARQNNSDSQILPENNLDELMNFLSIE